MALHEDRGPTEAVGQTLPTGHDLLQFMVDLTRGVQRRRTSIARPSGCADEGFVATQILIRDYQCFLQPSFDSLLGAP